MKLFEILDEGVAGPEKCWPGHRKVGTKPGTGKNAGKRVNDCEKIKEDQQLDEVAFLAIPIIGSVSAGMILSAVMTVLAAMDLHNTYQMIKKAGGDPDSMTDEDWMSLFIDVLFLIPALKYVPKAGKALVAKALPDSWKRAGANKVKDLVIKKQAAGAPKAAATTTAAKKAPDSKLKKTAKTVAGVTAGGLTGKAAYDFATGKSNPIDSVTGAVSSAYDGAKSLIGKTLGGVTGSGGDSGDKFSRWFGRTT